MASQMWAMTAPDCSRREEGDWGRWLWEAECIIGKRGGWSFCAECMRGWWLRRQPTFPFHAQTPVLIRAKESGRLVGMYGMGQHWLDCKGSWTNRDGVLKWNQNWGSDFWWDGCSGLAQHGLRRLICHSMFSFAIWQILMSDENATKWD